MLILREGTVVEACLKGVVVGDICYFQMFLLSMVTATMIQRWGPISTLWRKLAPNITQVKVMPVRED